MRALQAGRTSGMVTTAGQAWPSASTEGRVMGLKCRGRGQEGHEGSREEICSLFHMSPEGMGSFKRGSDTV